MVDRVLPPSLLEQLASLPPRLDVAPLAPECHELVAAALFATQPGHLVWLVGEGDDLEERRQRLEGWLGFLGCGEPAIHTHLLPWTDPYVNDQPTVARIEDRIRLQADLAAGTRCIVLSTVAALSLPLEIDFARRDPAVEIRCGATLARAELIARLQALGYQPRDVVEERGDCSWRGNVVDLFPVAAALPARIELAGSRVASIRLFDPESQRSAAAVDALRVPPNRLEWGEASGSRGTVQLADLLNCRFLLATEFDRLQADFRRLLLDLAAVRRAAGAAGRRRPPPEKIFSFPIDRLPLVSLNSLARDPRAKAPLRPLGQTLFSLDLDDIDFLRGRVGNGYSLFVHSHDPRLADNLRAYLPGFTAAPFALPESFECPETKSLFLTSRRFRLREPAGRTTGGGEEWVNDIRSGDLVVHRLHGIGRFSGFQALQLGDAAGEFLRLEYLGGEILYVPVYELEALKRYTALGGQAPQLDRLGGRSWKLKQERARRHIVTFARELLELYARRRSISGTAYAAVIEVEEPLGRGFTWELTDDQRQAIDRTLGDLEAEWPMDRLICGDVSFGKTEVALRAAVRVAANGRQVAVLCPTTILALQHYQTFSRRLAGLPLRVAMLSRLVDAAEARQVRGELAAGRVDILIGTHALLSRPVQFRDLGLYVIDEEQRFGVFQKERLKKGREEVDVLTLSATPIPRTLSMAMSGLQDISVIRTPPIGRLAVKNHVGLFSREVVVSAVLHELERGGLVFIIYNNIARIFEFRDLIAGWLKNVEIGVIHAEMRTEAIERALLDFIAQRQRVLLSTTIIENGIDIPAVNTLIVVDADRFGLPQLYQLRGRIGRSSRQAYAYFLVQAERAVLTEKARQRLQAIEEFSELGAGYKLAEFDLMLRGAGSLLGNRQHGHVEALGFEYYQELLRQTIADMKGLEPVEAELELKVHFAYAIDPAWIEETSQRIRVYRRILNAREAADLASLQEELRDRFGPPPAAMERIFYVGAVKLFARRFNWRSAEVFAERTEFGGVAAAAAPLPEAVNQEGDRLSIPFEGLERFLALETSLLAAFPTLSPEYLN